MPKNCAPETSFVSLRHIDKTFNPGSASEVALFSDFNFEAGRREFVSVIGGNGSGKTTMLGLICGNVQADSGEVFLDGRDIGRQKEHERAKVIGRVFQDPAKGTCPTLTILENMSLADHKGASYGLSLGVSRGRVDFYRSQLELLGLGLEDKIHLRADALSGGQRQALALLIAAMAPLELLILDEHTAALDPRSSETVMELTDRIVQQKNLTTVMVTHNLKHAAAYGGRLVMLHRGVVAFDVSGEEKAALAAKELAERFSEVTFEHPN
ncbi:MAG TPA: ATP-binding cassette domain-containing protein [Terriglobales bacterium]|nr:ATP-binding cassette domain-containing protein [Terriglobales bacterium]